jgi:hypothetical protein
METECTNILTSPHGDDSSTTNTQISPEIRLILDTLAITANQGYLAREVNRLDIKTIKTLTLLGFSINESLSTIGWGNATEGEALKIRDLTYEAVKKSLYPLMKKTAIQGMKTFAIPMKGWLVDNNKLLMAGSDYFTKDGLECITDFPAQSITGFSWKYSTFGFGLELQQLANYGILDKVLPYLKMVFERDGDDSRVVIDDKLTPYQLKYLAENENIHFENGEFFKRK